MKGDTNPDLIARATSKVEEFNAISAHDTLKSIFEKYPSYTIVLGDDWVKFVNL